MIVYGLKTCDTCRKAIKSLAAAGIQFSVVDVRKDGVSRADLQRFYAEFGPAIINRASTTWRELPEHQRMSDPIDLLSSYPTLMKRPVIEANGQLFLGWKADVQKTLLG